jgi:hypothetical protein
LGNLVNDYYRIKPGIITSHKYIYLHEDMQPEIHHFVADVDISVFRLIEDLVDEDIYIGGNQPDAIPLEAYEQLVENFPTTYEKKAYAQARVSSILKNYLETTRDSETRYHRYMNKKISRKGTDLQKLFKDMEVDKYKTILEKLEVMLKSENDYSEHEWQQEILQIIRFLYPKYVSVLSKVKIKDKKEGDREVDLLMVDSSGHIDVIEIKKPFANAIMTKSDYRNNFIPLRELSGTIMQVEKYVFFLNRWGAAGEERLTEKYKSQLPENLQIKITNPGGLIIMGRDDKLSLEQKLDFEVVKRKYKNVIDIITYDSLLKRLQITVEQMQRV